MRFKTFRSQRYQWAYRITRVFPFSMWALLAVGGTIFFVFWPGLPGRGEHQRLPFGHFSDTSVVRQAVPGLGERLEGLLGKSVAVNSTATGSARQDKGVSKWQLERR